MKNNINCKDKGITLVALVVTIIVLLILAGISISQLTKGGLFEKAIQAKEKSNNVQIKEDTILADYEEEIKEYIDGTRDTITTDYKLDGTETRTSERLDGKPIYARYITIEQRRDGSKWNIIEHNITDIDKIWIDLGNSYQFGIDGEYNFNLAQDGGGGSKCKVNKENIAIWGIGDPYYLNGGIKLLVRYTKTID